MLYELIYKWNLKTNTNKPIHKTETDLHTQKTNLWLPKEKGRGRREILAVWDY